MKKTTEQERQARERWGCPAWCVETHNSVGDTDHYGVLRAVVASDVATTANIDDGRVGLVARQVKKVHAIEGVSTEPRILLDIATDLAELPLSTAEARELAVLLNSEADMLDAQAERLCDREWCELHGRPIGEEPGLGRPNPVGWHQEHRRVLGTLRLPTGTLDKEPVTLTVRVQAWVDDAARVEIRHDDDGERAYDNMTIFFALDEIGPVSRCSSRHGRGVTDERRGGSGCSNRDPLPARCGRGGGDPRAVRAACSRRSSYGETDRRLPVAAHRHRSARVPRGIGPDHGAPGKVRAVTAMDPQTVDAIGDACERFLEELQSLRVLVMRRQSSAIEGTS